MSFLIFSRMGYRHVLISSGYRECFVIYGWGSAEQNISIIGQSVSNLSFLHLYSGVREGWGGFKIIYMGFFSSIFLESFRFHQTSVCVLMLEGQCISLWCCKQYIWRISVLYYIHIQTTHTHTHTHTNTRKHTHTHNHTQQLYLNKNVW